jgi:hypothetical protein
MEVQQRDEEKFGILRKKARGRHNPHPSTKKHHATKPLVHHDDEIGG